MTDGEVRAQVAIRDLLARATQAGDAGKADAYAACYAENGILELGDTSFEGRAALQRWMAAPGAMPTKADAPRGFVSHHLTTCAISLLSDNEAKARTYWLVISPEGLDHSGYYDDRFVLEGGAWLIAWRRPRTLWFAQNSVVAA